MSLLDDLGIRFNTDKASRNRVRDKTTPIEERPAGHNYLVKYDHFLRHLINKNDLKMLELGAGPDWNLGASAYMWAEYFRRCQDIHVAELRPSGRAIANERIHPRIGDLSDRKFLAELAQTEWDFIIDDASHLWSHQILALAALIPSVKEGGIYIVEDIQTSFGKLRRKYGDPEGRIFKTSNEPDQESGVTGMNRGCQLMTKLRRVLALATSGLASFRKSCAMTILSEISFYVAGGGDSHPALKRSKNLNLVQEIGNQIDSITFIGGSAILVKKSLDNTYLSG